MKKKLDVRIVKMIVKKRKQKKTFEEIARDLAGQGYVNGQSNRVTWQNVRYFMGRALGR